MADQSLLPMKLISRGDKFTEEDLLIT